MKFVPLGDQAVLAYLPDEAAAARFAALVRSVNPSWLHDVVPAYGSVGVFFDADKINMTDVIEWLQGNGLREPVGGKHLPPVGSLRPFAIPVCYEFALDMPRVCEHTGLTSDDVIRHHTSTDFTIYAIGFVPGFPYMGYLPEELRGVGRLPSPRVRVEPGSVGLTGKQTGIYPLPRPGGWNIIGRTPLTIVDVADGFFPLRVGDVVRFVRIDEAEFRRVEGERLNCHEP
ncbi:MAG: carboxyltransferase domain-containing protein [Gemmataceae bacterium]